MTEASVIAKSIVDGYILEGIEYLGFGKEHINFQPLINRIALAITQAEERGQKKAESILAETRAALEPVAQACTHLQPGKSDYSEAIEDYGLTAGHLRALAALAARIDVVLGGSAGNPADIGAIWCCDKCRCTFPNPHPHPCPVCGGINFYTVASPKSPEPTPPSDPLQVAVEALRALVTKLELVHADRRYLSVWTVSQIHVGTYTGPFYDTELKAAQAALRQIGGGK